MDIITKALLVEFSKTYQIEHLPEDKQFEHFVAFITLRRHHTRTFDTTDIVIGEGGDTGFDSIAIIVNGALVTDVDAVNELAERNNYLEVNFIFTQADRGASFESGKIGNFGFGVEDFFKPNPTLARNQKVAEAAAIKKAIFDRSNRFRTKPTCRLYYVTTGTWLDDQNLKARKDGGIAALNLTQLFSSTEFICYGANDIHRLYNQTKSAITREFLFREHMEIPPISGVTQAYLGYITAPEFIKIISDDSGDDILGSIFDENVRDWQNYNKVNKEIRDTLDSSDRARFVLMNNGVTIIARELKQLGSKFTIQDFQIVNGCQTSHVVFDRRGINLESAFIPLRLIVTQDDDVKESITRATNRQTELKAEQLYALTDFAKRLEMFFCAYPEADKKLYYERRDCQYDRFPEVEKTRIVPPHALIRSFGAMFLDEPTKVTRNYKSIRDQVGEKIFRAGDKLEPYYVAAFATYRLERLLRNQQLDSSYVAAKHHILMTFRYLVNQRKWPRMNSADIKKRCEEMTTILWDAKKSEVLLIKAAEIVREVVQGNGENFDRDHIRTEATKEALLRRFGVQEYMQR